MYAYNKPGLSASERDRGFRLTRVLIMFRAKQWLAHRNIQRGFKNVQYDTIYIECVYHVMVCPFISVEPFTFPQLIYIKWMLHLSHFLFFWIQLIKIFDMSIETFFICYTNILFFYIKAGHGWLLLLNERMPEQYCWNRISCVCFFLFSEWLINFPRNFFIFATVLNKRSWILYIYV